MSTSLAVAQRYMTMYGLSTFYIFGTIGNLILILICLQPTHRRNSGSFYLLSASIVNFILINLLLPPAMYGANNFDLQIYSLPYCKIRSYIVNCSLMIYRWCKIAACVDRAAMCNQRAWIRSFSSIRMAYRAILITVVVWLLIPIHIIFFYGIYNNRCTSQPGLYAKLYSAYAVVLAGWSPPILMATFGTIGYTSLKKIRARVTPMNAPNRVNDVSQNDIAGRQRISKRDQQLLISLVCEVILYISTNLLYSANVTYLAITANDSKTADRLRIEAFVSFFASPFLVIINNCAAFYLYLIVSSKFRKDLKKICMSYCRIRPATPEPDDQPTATNQRFPTRPSLAPTRFI